jgi:hypothetical protein
MWTNVTFIWSDWNTSTESFKKESDVYHYMHSIEEDYWIECEKFFSDNTEWTF